MQFHLPSNLKDAVISYDPVRKKQRRVVTNPTGQPRAKSKYPLGNPIDLIPPDVISPERLADAIETINSSLAADRYHSFVKVQVLEENPFSSIENVYAAIFHFESLWIAVWLPPANRQGEYVYGYTRAFKNDKKSRGMIPSRIYDEIVNNGEIKVYGRTEMFVETGMVTLDNIRNKKYSHRGYQHYAPWGEVKGYSAKTVRMSTVADKFEKTLSRTIPTWDRCDWYERICCSNSVDAVISFSDEIQEKLVKKYNKIHFSPDFLISAIRFVADKELSALSNGSYRSKGERELHCVSTVVHIIDTPRIKKWLKAKLDFINECFDNPDHNNRIDIDSAWTSAWKCLINIVYINSIWPDCPIDYYGDHLDQLSKVHIRSDHKERCPSLPAAWLNENMPVASFFQILRKAYEKAAEQDLDSNSSASYRVKNCLSDWNDTVDMLRNILSKPNNPVTLKVPKRWRISEFHDYVQGEAWKISNDNIDLPQDLFPVPIKVETADGNKWCFFQPINTHQLAQWGRAVRNCVGNASHYADGVKNKKHFIVLCNLNNNPELTIQLKVENGVMSVVQVVSTCNQRLDTAESNAYSFAFTKALHEREAQLSSSQVNH
jgi:hypothetical protein